MRRSDILVLAAVALAGFIQSCDKNSISSMRTDNDSVEVESEESKLQEWLAGTVPAEVFAGKDFEKKYPDLGAQIDVEKDTFQEKALIFVGTAGDSKIPDTKGAEVASSIVKIVITDERGAVLDREKVLKPITISLDVFGATAETIKDYSLLLLFNPGESTEKTMKTAGSDLVINTSASPLTVTLYVQSSNFVAMMIRNENVTTSSSTSQSPQLSYAGSSGTVGTYGVPMQITPTTIDSAGNSITSCSIKSGTTLLPAGLSVHQTTCVISGTPTVTVSAVSYTIIATNSVGNSADATVTLTVEPTPPSFSYSGASGALGTINQALSVSPTALSANYGTIASCVVKAATTALPSGVTVNNTTCVISGTPTVSGNSTQYTIQATNSGGGATEATVTIHVRADSDGDGVADQNDSCPGADDSLSAIRYKDADVDGLVVASSSSVCANDSTYTISAGSLSTWQLANLDSNDADVNTPYAAYTSNSKTEVTAGFDFDRDGTPNEAGVTIYLIGSPLRWIQFAQACNGATSTSCAYNIMLTSDIDFGQLDGNATYDSGASGDGKLTLKDAGKVLATKTVGGTRIYSGIMDGRGYKLKNLVVDMRSESGVDKGCGSNTECANVGGLAGQIGPNSAGKFIADINIEADVYGGKAVGGVVGSCTMYCTLSGVSHNGIVDSGEGSTSGVCGMGGLVGYLQMASIIDSSNHGQVGTTANSTAKTYVGGLIGYQYNGGGVEGYYVARSFNKASVTTTGSSVGGIAGYTSSNTLTTNRFYEVYNEGAIKGASSVGGIVGNVWNYSSIGNAYNVGTVTATTATTGQAGGVVGYYGNSVSYMENVYNSGIVRAPKPGGVIGGDNASTNSTKGKYLTGTTDSNNDGVINGSDSNRDNFTSTVLTGSQMKAAANFWAFGSCLRADLTTSGACSTASKTWQNAYNRCVDTAITTSSDCTTATYTWATAWLIDEGTSYPYLNNLQPTVHPGI
jgi:hypothetical protein